MLKVIEIRKLAAVDMAWLGPRVILVEYALGIVLPLAMGVVSLRAGLSQAVLSRQTAFGVWLVAIAGNYVPLFLYARSIAKGGTVQEEGRPDLAQARRYGLQQTIILVPFLVVLLSLLQERRRRYGAP